MPPYSLTEYKLRRYLYLGHEYSIYVPPSIRTSFWPKRHHDDITGVRIIGKIIKKNKAEDINSIVPIILKIKKEDTLHDDRLLIFALAVCTRFNLEPCRKMVADAYAAVSSICTDGLKLLMFVKFSSDAKSILHNEGYLPNTPSGFGHGFRKSMSKWYLNKDPLLTTEQIVKHKTYAGWSHKDIMRLIRIHPTDPSREIFVIHTFHGMEKVEELFGTKLKNVQIESKTDTFENKQLKFIYNFLKQVQNIQNLNENALRNEIELHRWGHSYEVIPQNMLKSSKILTSLVMHMPLRELLDNTFYFAKQRLFHNSTPDVGLWEFILRFNNSILLKKSKIHPIESFIEYVKYCRTRENILTLQNNIIKNQKDFQIELPDSKLKVFLKINKTVVKNDDSNLSQNTKKTSNTSSEKEGNITESNVKNESKFIQAKPSKSKKKKKFKPNISKETESVNKIDKNNPESTEKTIQSETNDIDQSQLNIIMLKPPPKLVEQLLTFLSEDLIKKTLENLEPSGRRIMITYDSRIYLKNTNCKCTHLLKVQEAITLITLSLIYPDKLPNKPTICSMDESGKQCYKEIEIDYNESLTFSSLNSILFKAPVNDKSGSDKKKIPDINPLPVMNWAKENNKEFDVFVFLGTNTMNLKTANKVIKEYQAFLKKPVKIIICCLNGKHVEQMNLSRTNMLFTVGFDKNIGKIIDSFINAEF